MKTNKNQDKRTKKLIKINLALLDIKELQLKTGTG